MYQFNDGARTENVSNWGLAQFRDRYRGDQVKIGRRITKKAIFHYVYGVLHDPVYREKYALNLRRELPRIPFYADFWQWADWGKALMDLHIGYETVDRIHTHQMSNPGLTRVRLRCELITNDQLIQGPVIEL